MRPDKEKAISRSIGLTPEDWAIAAELRQAQGLPSTSAAIRYILQDWQRMTAPESPPPDPGAQPGD
jgi:hypothetical protein